MLLSDNETKFDLLKNESIAETIIDLIKESQEKPVSIGIHGDWGAGKSSILKMIEANIANDNEINKKYICLTFNGWRHQGFEDSKVALMSSIISELENNKTIKAKFGDTVKEKFKKVWGSINWISVAKYALKAGVAYSTGGLILPDSVIDYFKAKYSNEDERNKAIDDFTKCLDESKIFSDNSSNKMYADFQNNFKELFKEAGIEKLVILIDDLDRCLPEVVIETLEAVRLFMFVDKTAFVIAADEDMIRYAVKKHFPDVIDNKQNNIGDTFADKYLEKLIQVPFRIPVIGHVEACTYITLLMIQSKISEIDQSNYDSLIKIALDRLKRPWKVDKLKVDEISKYLKDDYESVENEVNMAAQVGDLLADNTDGNPRKIKRFINMLLLRKNIAINRGFGDEISIKILAKIMLAERFWPDFYNKLPKHLTEDGIWDGSFEMKSEATGDEAEGNSKSKWYEPEKLKSWLESEPEIIGIDLRPYYYACKEKLDFFSDSYSRNDLGEILSILLSSKGTMIGKKNLLLNLTEQETEKVFDIVQQKIIEYGTYEQQPKGVDGLRYLTEVRPILRPKLISFVKLIPVEKAGPWILQDWNGALPESCEEHNALVTELRKRIKNKGSKELKAMAEVVMR